MSVHRAIKDHGLCYGCRGLIGRGQMYARLLKPANRWEVATYRGQIEVKIHLNSECRRRIFERSFGMAREIKVWQIGNTGLSSKLGWVSVSDEVGLNARFHRFPAGWSKNEEKMEHVSAETTKALDQLVKEHPVLGGESVMKWLGLIEP